MTDNGNTMLEIQYVCKLHPQIIHKSVESHYFMSIYLLLLFVLFI